ncbi:molybdate ABC transporter substrate-binding protein [Ornithinimicrobium pekingense]|nr:molybdate ABC transporter substrate-binding protein [Ornithinimicrobium pekingense]
MTSGSLRRVVTTARTAALALVPAVLLAACGAADDGAAGDDDPAGPRTVTVLAAASLTDVLELVAADLESDHEGVRVELSFAASSTVVQQVQEGAPADVVALAGQEPLELLEASNRAGEPVVFTTNTLALAVPADNPAGIEGPEDLARDGIRLVVCRPEAPCGAAAQTLFAQLGISPAISSYEPDVRATLAKVSLGEADAGVVYNTDVATAADGVLAVEIPPQDNVVSRYPILAVSDNPLARVFIDEVLSARGQQHLADAGFVAP